tara:strand:- start:76940 stop:78646 length:1707 start_codon:yes stop_codon:yes gene_type:complete
MRYTPLFSLLLLLCIPAIGTAQTTQSEADRSLLPEINPQDIEIRSEFRARFPGLRRQSILGFNPEPRVFQIDANRMPFIENRDEAVADLSVTELDRPEPPQRSLLTTPTRQNLYVRGGFGSFLSPELEAFGFYELNEKSLLSSDVNFSGSNGHLENQESGFRFLDANISYYEKTNEDYRFKLEGGVVADKYSSISPYSDPNSPEKENLGASVKGTVKKMENAFTGFEASLGGSIFESELSLANSQINSFLRSGTVSEKTYFASFSKFWAGQRMYETFDVSAQFQGGNYGQAPLQNWITAGAALEYERLLNFTTRVTGEVGFQYVSDPFSNKFYVTPEVQIKHNFTDAFSVSGSAFTKPKMQTQQEHLQYNRFLGGGTELRHAYVAGVKGEANYQLFEGNRIFAGASYNFTRDYAYYQRRDISGPTNTGFYNINYANANILEFYTGASYQLIPEKFWADGRVYFRAPNLSSGQTIPYEEKLGVKGAVSYKPIQALTINGWTEYIGKRQSPETNTELNAYLLLNAGAEYQINDTFGVYAKLLNILGQDYEIWNGYQERPFQIFGGITIKL